MAYRSRVPRPPEWRRTLISTIALMAMSVALAGCLHDRDVAVSDAPTARNDLRAEADRLGKRYSASPGEKNASLGYARALSALDQQGQAAAVLQAAAVKSPRDQEVLAAYGKALVDTGDYNQALEVLARAHSPDRPDWHILSAEGIASDGIGLHDRAQAFYLSALKIAPGDPGVMSNLGLSYALSKRLPEAERVLTEAAQNPSALPRVRQNLALVLALQGRFDNATQALRRDLTPADAATNVAEIRSMLAQPNTWDAIRGKGPSKDAQTTAISRSNGAPQSPPAQTAQTQIPE